MTVERTPPPAAAQRSPGEQPPPPGWPWDAPVAEAPFAFLDLEMTGLRIGEDRIVEICIEHRNGERLETLINPGERRGAEHVHGISEEELRAAPTFAEVADRIVALHARFSDRTRYLNIERAIGDGRDSTDSAS